jgi:DNA helicase-2/ATP-dependent DNA helicase PcrA
MLELVALNEAEQAAERAFLEVATAIAENRSFVLEAGAGAGKTHSLIRVLKHLIATMGHQLRRHRQRVACITYTNVAKEEIEARTDRDPAIYCDTIHAFCWSLLKDFQNHLRQALCNLERWKERLDEVGGIGSRRIEYTLGSRVIDEHSAFLHHDDVIRLFTDIVRLPKFRAVMVARFPVLLIDEYQDMNAGFAQALKEYFLCDQKSLLIGFFGDHWQKIYQDVCGRIEHPNLARINKGANFRSVRVIVDVLNRMRPELPQAVVDREASGSVDVYLTNDWHGKRLTGPQWKGDLPPEAKQKYISTVKDVLVASGWSLDATSSKVLMLTHKALAAEQGYQTLAGVFPYTSDYIDKEDNHIKFLVDILEPVCEAYEAKRYASMFSILNSKVPAINGLSEKRKWSQSMQDLLQLRAKGTVGEVLDHLRRSGHPTLPDELEELDRMLTQFANKSEEQPQSVTVLRNLRDVSYSEVIRLRQYLEGHTPFSTKHGVKGAEFESVLVIVGMGWNRYNFNQLLELAADPAHVPQDKRDAFERSRNLFYVCCSRPKKRLAVLFTQEVSARAANTLTSWFGADAVHSLGNL